jgi:sporulation protein YlmC with PRC-barrel domain
MAALTLGARVFAPSSSSLSSGRGTGRGLGGFHAAIRELCAMPAPSGHSRAILASKVKGTSIYNRNGEKLGHVEDIVLDKMSNEILFAVLGSGGILGAGEKYFPVPWSVLDYDTEKDAYVVPFGEAELKKAPTYRLEDLTKSDGQALTTTSEYYSSYAA